MHRLLALLLLVPVAAAGSAPPGSDVVAWTQFVHQDLNATFGPVTFEVHRPHAWNVTNGTSILEVQANYHIQTQDAPSTARFTLDVDGTTLATCQWRVDAAEDPGGLGVKEDHANPSVGIHCLSPALLEPGTHTVHVKLVAGDTTPVEHAVTTILLHQQETVNMDLDVTITPSTFANVVWLVWVIYFILTNTIRQPTMRILAAFVGYGLVALPVDPEQFVVILTAQTLAVLYHIFRTFTRLD